MLRRLIGGVGVFGLFIGLTAVPANADPILAPNLTVSADPAVLDPDHPTAVLSGQVTSPTDDTPVVGLGVHLWVQHNESTIADVTTDATGHFTASFSPTEQDIDSDSPNQIVVEASTPYTTEHAGTTTSVFVKLNRPQLGMTLTVDRTKADQGVPVSVTGTVQRPTETGTAPAAGVTVDLSDCGVSLGSVTTDDTGRFATKANLVCTDAIWARAHGSLYQLVDAYTPTITVRPKPRFWDIQASLDANGTVAIRGETDLGRGTASVEKQPVAIQYSTGNGSWRTVATTKFQTSDGIFATSFFTGRSGYYRASFAGNADYTPAVSSAVKLWRWNTRFDKFKVSPHSVRKNHTVTVSGTLSRAVSMTKRSGYASRKVEVIFRFKGKKTWYHLAWAKTDKHGKFSKKVKAYGSGYYAVVFYGGSDTFSTGTDGKAYVRATGAEANSVITLPGRLPAKPVTATP
ncbi:hypothetical protein [Actinoallomurus rhizosphaericola]|uniref:hypothetical protein n=1 Tax=Actinoallomurus rhizosphaericola TaxID=2952536 RepID=UPI0020937DE4|nr:hypothetical protein [Actinoallomurus rhizosphaericola]MCO6000011.1 hypothetical protein [Actinoallomurus rhizosphaericola]